MATLTNIEIGSIVNTLIENVPTGISGLMPTLVNQSVYTAELITGNNIPLTAIDDPYQPGVTSLTIGNVLSLMGAQGIGTKSVKIGELSVDKGMNESSAKEWKDLGMSQLQEIGEQITYYQSWGSR